METTNKKLGYGIWAFSCVIFFLLGYLLYPQTNTYKKMAAHTMSDGTMMYDNDMAMSHMTMRQMMDSMSASLVGKKGNDFDSAFLEEMIPHHQGAVAMAQMVLATSKRPELIKLANDIITSQQKEIDQMRSWQRTWFGVQPL